MRDRNGSQTHNNEVDSATRCIYLYDGQRTCSGVGYAYASDGNNETQSNATESCC